MRKSSSALAFSREVVYRAVLTLRKFLIEALKQEDILVTSANIRIYGCAAMLIASKIDYIGGNFLDKRFDVSVG